MVSATCYMGITATCAHLSIRVLQVLQHCNTKQEKDVIHSFLKQPGTDSSHYKDIFPPLLSRSRVSSSKEVYIMGAVKKNLGCAGGCCRMFLTVVDLLLIALGIAILVSFFEIVFHISLFFLEILFDLSIIASCPANYKSPH